MTFSSYNQSLLDEIKRMHCSELPNLDALAQLLDLGADPNASNDQGESAIGQLMSSNFNPSSYNYRLGQALELLIDRGANPMDHFDQLVVLFDGSDTARSCILSALFRRQTNGEPCLDNKGNNPLHVMLRSRFAMNSAHSILRHMVIRQSNEEGLHEDWLHAPNLDGNTPMLVLWSSMISHANIQPFTGFACGISLEITSNLMHLGGDLFQTNVQGENTLDLIAKYQSICAFDLPAKGALLSHITAWKMREGFGKVNASGTLRRI